VFTIMDNELKNFRLNINQLATLTDLHRQTISSKLSNVEPTPGSNAKLKLYSVLDILKELLSRTTSEELVDVDKMLPPDRKAWFQSERERLKFQQETGELIPASEVVREFSSMAKAVVQVLETLPDILERDCAMTPAAVVRVQRVIDDLRDQIALKVEMADTPHQEEDFPEEE
jgi:phage terminase Nu1 subunit (DNA packaging protein)